MLQFEVKVVYIVIDHIWKAFFDRSFKSFLLALGSTQYTACTACLFMLVFQPLIWMYDTSISSNCGFFRWIISLCTLPNLLGFTALFQNPYKLAEIKNYCVGACSVMEKSTFSVFIYSLSIEGAVFIFLAMRQMALILTCALKGTMMTASPSQSDVMNSYFSNLRSCSRNSPLPLFEYFSLRQRTLSLSMAAKRSFAFYTPRQSLQPQLGPCTCYITKIYSNIIHATNISIKMEGIHTIVGYEWVLEQNRN